MSHPKDTKLIYRPLLWRDTKGVKKEVSRHQKDTKKTPHDTTLFFGVFWHHLASVCLPLEQCLPASNRTHPMPTFFDGIGPGGGTQKSPLDLSGLVFVRFVLVVMAASGRNSICRSQSSPRSYLTTIYAAPRHSTSCRFVFWLLAPLPLQW